MNKMIKGSVAGATGVALLMGGFGTYALWSDSENLSATTVQSGELDIATSAGSYDDANSAAANDWTSSDKMVPGDKVTYTQKFTVKATGKNMKGTVKYTKPALTAGSTFSSALTHAVTVTSNNVDVVATTGNNFKFDGPVSSAELTAVVTYTLPSGTTGDQSKTATLPAAAFSIEQG